MLPSQWWAAGALSSSARAGRGVVGGASIIAAAANKSREAAWGSGWVGATGVVGG